jgi:activator of HSP90 ATPase
MKTKTVRQTVTFKATPHEIYEMLMDSGKHARFTGDKATISRTVGGRFSVYDGGLTGVNLELVPDRRIVQSWRSSDWPEGHFSRVTFALAEVAGGTRLAFRQSGVPEDEYDDISQGWRDYYWEPMREMLREDGK